MHHRFRRSLALAGALAILAVVATTLVRGNHSSTASVGPPDCFVGSSPITAGVSAPTDLSVEIVYHASGYWTVVRWSDNSDNETCFVIEKGALSVPFVVAATVPADSECLLDTTQNPNVYQYRVYAADADERSGYSNIDGEPGPIAQTATPGPFTPVPTPTHIPGCVVYAYPTFTPGPTGPLPTPMATPTPVESWARADLNCDDSVDSLDALLILRSAAGLEANIPASC